MLPGLHQNPPSFPPPALLPEQARAGDPASSPSPAAELEPTSSTDLATTKMELLRRLPTLDRGAAASTAAASEVETAATRLAALAGPVDLAAGAAGAGAGVPAPALQGSWSLAYSGQLARTRRLPAPLPVPGVPGQVSREFGPGRMEHVTHWLAPASILQFLPGTRLEPGATGDLAGLLACRWRGSRRRVTGPGTSAGGLWREKHPGPRPCPFVPAPTPALSSPVCHPGRR